MAAGAWRSSSHETGRTGRRNDEEPKEGTQKTLGIWEVKYTWVMYVYSNNIYTMYHRMYMYTLIHHHRMLYENDVYTYDVYPYKCRLDKHEHHQRWHSVKVHNSSTRPNICRLQSYWISTVFFTQISLNSRINHPAIVRPQKTIFKKSIIAFLFKSLPDSKACSIARVQNHWT